MVRALIAQGGDRRHNWAFTEGNHGYTTNHRANEAGVEQ